MLAFEIVTGKEHKEHNLLLVATNNEMIFSLNHSIQGHILLKREEFRVFNETYYYNREENAFNMYLVVLDQFKSKDIFNHIVDDLEGVYKNEFGTFYKEENEN